MKIIGGPASVALADAICDHLGCRRAPLVLKTFKDGEVRVQIEEDVRGADVFIIQSTCPPVSHNLMQLFLTLDTLRRAGAGRITAVVPYYGYSRQDTKIMSRSSIGAKLMADLLTASGMDRLLTVDLHSGQIQGFFDVPVDNLFASPVMTTYIRTLGDDLVVVSPDAGGVERARDYASRLGCGLAIIDMRREGTQVFNVIGEVRDKTAIIVDDMIDSGGRISSAARAVCDNGAAAVFACATHPVLSGTSAAVLEQSPLQEIIVTDTIPLRDAVRKNPKFKVLSMAGLLAKAIHNTHAESSISALFD
jgi:ribose-phosphate pyrophosphokinase